MNKAPDGAPPEELDVLMERLRTEIAAKAAPTDVELKAEPAREITSIPDAPPLSVRQLLALPAAEFVSAAYWAVLGRVADPEGRKIVQRRLDIGLASRIDVLAELRRSEEGRTKRRPVPGLAWRVTLHRVRTASINNAIRSILRLLRSMPRLALYMRTVVARVDGTERRAVNAEAIAMRLTAELAQAQKTLGVLTAANADLAKRVSRLERASRGHDVSGTADADGKIVGLVRNR